MNAPVDSDRLSMTLTDRYTVDQGWLYMTGMQALVRLPLQQHRRDAANGLNTGGYISGYRGSPLGRYDIELWSAEKFLKEENIVFRPAVNEDLAATALWGSQYVGVFPGAKVDGVFGLWYGKGPGVDRSGDPFRHANQAGSAPHGGVLALAGDDHGAKSSTVANFSDLNFAAAGIPVLYPANAQEVLDFGLHGIAMSRFSGCWSAMKLVTDVVEGGGSVYVAPDSPAIALPPLPSHPDGGVNSRRIDRPLAQEERLYHHKLNAALAYVRANGLNRIVVDPPRARVGVMAAGKAWQDLRQALQVLGIDDKQARELGVRILKVGVVWPLDPEIVRKFADGLATVLVVEEKRPLLEDQVRNALYGTARPPRILGKHAGGGVFDAALAPRLFPNAGEISPDLIARVLGEILIRDPDCYFDPARLAGLAPVPGFSEDDHGRNDVHTMELRRLADGRSHTIVPLRAPTFCSGCPHARSTRVPEGSRALAGIGCHSTAILQDPVQTTTWSHMGGEGVLWLGQQPFTDEKHVFANIGDGTLFHSGFLAVRQAVAAHVPMTYKLLFNGFVSMTGGQPVDGELGVPQILAQFAAEGVRKMVVVTDDVSRYQGVKLPDGVPVRPRDELEAVQRELREYGDVSVMVFDQPCATERRRLRKRGKWQDPDVRTFINTAVCEGCGDCGRKARCLSIEPVDTELGRKRRINQSTCNKDFSCQEGFCPSFVTVEGARLRRPEKAGRAQLTPMAEWADKLPAPEFERPAASFSILVTGIGGTGVVTIGQTLAMAAHLDGYCSSNLDVTGLSQKYGAVLSHVKLAPEARMLHATRIASREADTLIGCDLIVSAGDETIERLDPRRTRGVVCTDMVPTSDFSRDPDWRADDASLLARVRSGTTEALHGIDAQRLSRALLGDAIGANMILMGAAWQMGAIPLSLAAIERAIELNGVALAFNQQAFAWGRRLIVDREAVLRAAAPPSRANTGKVVQLNRPRLEALDDIVRHRRALLADYGIASAKIDGYTRWVERIGAAEAGLGARGAEQALAATVARQYAKLLAHKDEFEVARLYSSAEFKRELDENFEPGYRLRFHVAGGPFGRTGPDGKLQKRAVGPWLMSAFRWLARFRGLRGSLLDPWRNSDERKLARQLLADYESDLTLISGHLDANRLETAQALAGWPEKVRGYGHVRAEQAAAAQAERTALRERLSGAPERTSPTAVRAA
ncbi:MAG: indolepyruvate ferredoxin oxidoreductase family protein [Burkholderiaceae bacterium]